MLRVSYGIRRDGHRMTVRLAAVLGQAHEATTWLRDLTVMAAAGASSAGTVAGSDRFVIAGVPSLQ